MFDRTEDPKSAAAATEPPDGATAAARGWDPETDVHPLSPDPGGAR